VSYKANVFVTLPQLPYDQLTFATRRLPSLSKIRIALTIYIEGSCNMQTLLISLLSPNTYVINNTISRC